MQCGVQQSMQGRAHNASVCGEVEILKEVEMEKGKGCGEHTFPLLCSARNILVLD